MRAGLDAGVRAPSTTAVPWRMFGCLVDAGERMWRWPDKAWLPLALSIKVRK
jgi:hypothetical protein